ncbi:OmpH family outer membrane protein [uncultured Dubosiella sp.]|uniref:OmpH family outer membrane protein n=2 Tax=uncultured Dubosiella sp. TaxID=1937011 RepID=UPI0025CFC35D|nr:OmpH family outer membrane protein [uncultured Dubosiella sp.]
MSDKDLTQKALLRLPDVFASLINFLIFDNCPVIHPDQICPLDIPAQFDYDFSLNPVYRDASAMVLDPNGHPSFIVNFENQTAHDPTMPIRAMGYTDTAYFWQRSQLIKSSRPSLPFSLSRFVLSLTIVLHYGKDPWKARSLHEIIHLEQTSLLKPFVSNYTMNLENIAWWDEERIASIGSDFRFIADYCVQMRKSSKAGRTRYDPPAGWKIEHVEETLMTLAAFSKDEALREGCWKYLEKFKLNPKKGETTMASVLDHYFEKKEKLYLEREQQYLIKEKEYQAKEKEYQAKEKEYNEQLKAQTQQIQEKDLQLNEMLSTFVRLAQQRMVEKGMSAQEACDTLGYKENIRKLVLPYLIS